MALAAHALPPAADAFDGEGGGVVIDADADPALVGGDVVDAVGNGPAVGRDHEVVHAHFLGLALGAQLPAGVPEIANQLLFLGVDRDRRLAGPPEAADAGVDVLELGVAVGMLAALAGLGVGLQAEAQVLQQPPDQVWSTRYPRSANAPARCRWLRLTHSRAACGSPRIADATSSVSASSKPGCSTTAALRPPPLRRTRPFGQADAALSRSRRPRPIVLRAMPVVCDYRRDAAAARRARLAGGEQTQAPLIEMRRDRFVAPDEWPSCRSRLD